MVQMQALKPWPEGVDMDFGIRWQTFEQALRAKEVSFDAFWLTKHQFLRRDRALLGARSLPGRPLTAHRPDRLGHAVVVLPCNHPVRVGGRQLRGTDRGAH